MSNKGTAYAIATAIYAGTHDQEIVDIDDLSDRLYRTLDRSPFGTDEAKADLYATLAESLTADTTFERAVNIIEAAIDNTEKYLG